MFSVSLWSKYDLIWSLQWILSDFACSATFYGKIHLILLPIWWLYHHEQLYLQELSLGGFGLTAVPSDVWKSRDISKCDLSGNSIEELPLELCSCISLEVHNVFSCFPMFAWQKVIKPDWQKKWRPIIIVVEDITESRIFSYIFDFR